MAAVARATARRWRQWPRGARLVVALFAVTIVPLLATATIGYGSNDHGSMSAAYSPSPKTTRNLQRRPVQRYSSQLTADSLASAAGAASQRVGRSAPGAAAEQARSSWLRRYFRPTMPESAKTLALRTLLEADLLLRSVGVQYFLYGGTLIGSYRHHGMIPWDDDVDILVNASQRELVRTALSDRPGYGLYDDYQYTYKWYSLAGSGSAGKSFKWPYIDIFFFDENDTHIYDAERKYCRRCVYRKADVFPLVLRPFEGELLPSPRNPAAVLATLYNVSTCQTSKYVHSSERYIPPKMRITVECEQLYSMFPFAFCQKKVGDVCAEEVLKIGSTIISKFVPQLLPEKKFHSHPQNNQLLLRSLIA